MKRSKTGRANINFYNCDNMEFMSSIPTDYYDLAIVDPPYGIGMAGGKVGNSKKDYKNFSGDDVKIPSKTYFDQIFRVSKNQIIWGGNYMIKHLYPTPCYIIWDKVQPEKFTMAMCEFAWASFDKPAKIYKQRIVGADDYRIHPTQKPVKLYEWLLHNYAKQGDKILDTHGGSASIALACWNLGFDLDLCELDKDYFNESWQRFEIHTQQGQLF